MQLDFSQVNLAAPSWDMFVILLVVVLALIYSALLGKNRIIVYSLGLYIALALSQLLAATPWGGMTLGVYNISLRAIVFVGLAAILFLVLPKILPGKLGESHRRRKFWPGVVVGIFHVGFLIGLILSFLPGDFVRYWLPLSGQILAAPVALLAWGTLVIIAVAVTHKRHRDE